MQRPAFMSMSGTTIGISIPIGIVSSATSDTDVVPDLGMGLDRVLAGRKREALEVDRDPAAGDPGVSAEDRVLQTDRAQVRAPIMARGLPALDRAPVVDRVLSDPDWDPPGPDRALATAPALPVLAMALAMARGLPDSGRAPAAMDLQACAALPGEREF